MKLFIFISGLLIASSTWAADLRLITGHINGKCHVSNDVLIHAARNQSLHQAGPDKVQVSAWEESVSERGTPYADDICLQKVAWATALFVNKEEQGQTYYLTLNYSSSNPRKDWNVPGDNTLSDEEAWNESLVSNRNAALKYCKAVPQEKILSKTKKLYTGRSWFDLYTVEVRFQCEL